MKQKLFILYYVIFALFKINATDTYFQKSNPLSEDFEVLNSRDSTIIEKGPKATAGVDWQFELTNNDKSTEPFLIFTLSGGSVYVPWPTDPNSVYFETNFPYEQKYTGFKLEFGQTVRIAGLPTDSSYPLTLKILTYDEVKRVDKEGQKLAYGVPGDLMHLEAHKVQEELNRRQKAIEEKRFPLIAPHWIEKTFKLKGKETAFLIFENNQIKPLQKGYFSNKTKSGLSLTNNITK